MDTDRYRILVTNDDGIHSPGLHAAAEALKDLGEVTIIAPHDQVSATGRSMPSGSDGSITPITLTIQNQEWEAFAVGGTPAQVVQHGVLEIMPEQPDLIVAGINYGENVGTSITISGTIGAALEAAAMGIPAMTVSFQLLEKEHFSNYAQLDFSSPAHFLRYFARIILSQKFSGDIDLLKIDVPAGATTETPWKITRLAKHRYYQPESSGRKKWKDKSSIWFHSTVEKVQVPVDSDIYAMLFDKVVSVTPISMDMTSRVDLHQLEKSLKSNSLDVPK